jgi:hypothetical protein
MKIPRNVIGVLLNADGKALGTVSHGEINVIPVSTIKLVDNKIWLINYFMGKTVKNILENKQAVLTCWKKLEGYKLKCKAEYISDLENENFIQAKKWISEILPERIVKGLLVLEVTEIFDVSADKESAGKKIEIL